jgi:hypothetical protein
MFQMEDLMMSSVAATATMCYLGGNTYGTDIICKSTITRA